MTTQKKGKLLSHLCFCISGTDTTIIKEHKRNIIKHASDEYLKRNTSLLQEEFMSLCNVTNLPIRILSAKEITHLSDFTKNQLLDEKSTFQCYRGVLDNQASYIKKFHSLFKYVGLKGIMREIVVATQLISAKKNAVKLLACCLETDLPILVYEFLEMGSLRHQIHTKHDEPPLPWKIRVKIGSEISNTLAHLQVGFMRPIIHRNLHADDVFLDNCTAKLAGFYFSVPIPEGEVHVNDAVVGTGYTEPLYALSGRLTAKTDVYLFGVLFLEVLAGKLFFSAGARPHLLDKAREYQKGGRENQIVDSAVLTEVRRNGEQRKLQEVLDLVFRCTADKQDDRPSMVDVAIELKETF